jgi:hypothetical protein
VWLVLQLQIVTCRTTRFILACVVNDERELYRKLIDALVRECRQGQGQIGPARARAGTSVAAADERSNAAPS